MNLSCRDAPLPQVISKGPVSAALGCHSFLVGGTTASGVAQGLRVVAVRLDLLVRVAAPICCYLTVAPSRLGMK